MSMLVSPDMFFVILMQLVSYYVEEIFKREFSYLLPRFLMLSAAYSI